MVSGEMTSAVDQIREAVGQVSPIRWCTPAGVAGITAAIAAAAQDSHATRLEVTPQYPKIASETVLGRIRCCRSYLHALGHHPMVQPIATYLDHAEETVTAIASRDDDRFSTWSAVRYGRPSEEIVARAWGILGEDPSEHEEEVADVSADHLRDIILAALDRYDIHDWQVITTERMSTMAVDQALRCVSIREDARFNRSEVARLVVHEVGAHVLRGVNASRQTDPTAGLPLGDAVGTEEGLAGWFEHQLGVATPRTLRVYAARTIATHLAASEGILTIVRALAPYVGWSAATAIGLRVKRGLSDLNRPGGYLKDQVYLRGLVDVSEALRDNPDWLQPLMAVKWSIEHLGKACAMLSAEDLQAPDLTPEWETLGLDAFLGRRADGTDTSPLPKRSTSSN